MLAEIIVDKKAVRNKSFTYSIPNNLNLKVGSLVLVPFRNQRITGVVKAIQKNEAKKFRVKKIEKIIYPQALLNKNQFKLAKFIAKKYFAPFASVIFTILPQYLRKKKRSVIPTPCVIPAKAGIYPLDSVSRHGMTSNNYLLFDPQNKYTLKIYQKAINSALLRGQSVLLLMPDLSLDFMEQLKLCSKKSLILDKKCYTNKEIFLKWQAIRRGKYNLVIGSHLALFAPLDNLGLVIVHEERNQYYKNEQSPKYHLREVAIELARLNNANLILQAQIPSLESYFALKNKKIQLIPWRGFPAKIGNIKQIKIVDLKQERGLISLQAQKMIEDNFKKRKKTLLFLNRKGFSRLYICPDCDFSKHFESQEEAPALCPNCQGTTGRKHSFGTKRLEFEIKKMFPQTRILRVDNESKKIKNLKLKIENYDVIIATSYIFKHEIKFDTTIIVLAEIGLSLPDFRSEENLFYTLFRAQELGRNNIIQTFYPEHRVIKYLLQNNFKDFAEEELKIRRENNYPPLTTLIRLTYEGKSSKKEAKRLANLLNKLNRNYNCPNEILGPAPVFIQPAKPSRATARDLKYEIILKGKKPYPLLSLVPDKWKVDVDPVELLK